MNTSRSCSRLRRPAQNSTSSRTIRKPPQKSGTGTSSPPPWSGKAAARAAYCASSSAPDSIGSDCREAHAEMRDAHGRESKYCLDLLAGHLDGGAAEPDRAVHRRPGQGRRDPRTSR